MPALPKRDRQRFLGQMKRDPLFALDKVGNIESATSYQFTDMLNCSPDAPRDVISAKFRRLQGIALVAGDSEIVAFLKTCEDKFSSLLVPLKTTHR